MKTTVKEGGNKNIYLMTKHSGRVILVVDDDRSDHKTFIIRQSILLPITGYY